MIFKRITLYIILLLFIAGCSYTRSHRLPTILTTSEWRGIIPKGQTFRVIRSAEEGLKDVTFPDQDMVVLSTGKLQELEEVSISRMIKKSRLTKKQAMVGGGITSLLGIIATVFWNRRRKIKLEGNIKAEG